jgi:hemolysin III
VSRQRSLFREPTSGFTHLAGAVLSFLFLILLIILTWEDIPKMIAVVVFAATATLLYSASAILHLTYAPPKMLNTLNRLDRVSIYLVIAGTYTPICYAFWEGTWRVVILVLVWSIAIIGSLYVIFRYKRGITNVLPMTLTYIAMGVLGVVAIPQATIPTGAIGLIAAGGLTYLVGSVVYSLDKPNLHPRFNAHDLWHIFVLTGSGFFYAMILLYVVPG